MHIRFFRYWTDIFIVLILLYAPIAVLNPVWLMANRLPTGGDTASHVFYAAQFCAYFPIHGLTQWLPEVFGGLPFLSYYFPLPFIVVYVLSFCLPFALAFKWSMFLAAVALPASVYLMGITCFCFSRLASAFAALATLAFLLHEQNSIWGGNLLSVLAGEFCYSYGMLFSLLTGAVWIKALQGRYYWLLAAMLEAATGFSHGYALLLTGFSSLFLLACGSFKQTFVFLTLSHGLAFLLLAGWLWPLLEMHGFTVANDGPFLSDNWRDFLPMSLWPVLGLGGVGVLFFVIPVHRRQLTSQVRQVLAFILATALLAATFWYNANRIGLADVRFFPYVWLLLAILGGGLFGEALHVFLGHLRHRSTRILGKCLAVVLWVSMGVWVLGLPVKAPQWSEWNHSGYQDKLSWQRLASLFPVLAGKLDSPRLLFEHAPENNDIGSTRALEALPMFLGQRPVLEGLYMESALLAPEIYQLQAEISAVPSSPLVRFPSGTMDIDRAIAHMQLLHSNQVLVRSASAKVQLAKHPTFVKLAEADPFSVFQLQTFTSQLVEPLPLPVQAFPEQKWQEHAFRWFKKYPQVDYWPVYSQTFIAIPDKKPTNPIEISQLRLERQRVSFHTNQPGFPHLLKMAYHPRWQMGSAGQLYLAAPGYLLVVPQTADVELVYGTTSLGKLGELASLLAAGVLLWQCWRRRFLLFVNTPPARSIRRGLWFWLGLLVAINAEAYSNNPERHYSQAWQAMRKSHYAAAALAFDASRQGRHHAAAQEEATFWAAKAYELAGERVLAKQRYQLIAEQFDGYWLPESLYTLAKLHRLDQHPEQSAPIEQRLRHDFPQNPYSQSLDAQ